MTTSAAPPAIPPTTANITGLILAGGQGTRMGGLDKGLVTLGGQTMIEHVIARLRPQVAKIVISANRNLTCYREFGYVVVEDDGTNLGPLAGIRSGLQHAQTDYVITVPCDSPMIGNDLVTRLARALTREDAAIAVADDGTRKQWAFVLLARSWLPDISAALASGERSIAGWLARHAVAQVDFSDCAATFTNVNDIAERDALEARLHAG